MKRKIIISLTVIFTFLALGISLTMSYIGDTVDDLRHIITLHQVEEQRRSLLISLQAVQANLYTVNTPLAVDMDLIVSNALHLEKKAKECSSCHHPPNLMSRIVIVQKLVREYEDQLSFYITRDSPTRGVRELYREKASDTGKTIMSEVENMSHGASKILDERTNLAWDKIRRANMILVATVVATMIVVIVASVFLTRSITRPIDELLAATKMVTSGNLGTKVSYADKNEFGELADTFNTMSVALKEREDTLGERTAELKKRVHELEEFYAMAVGRELKMKELKEEIKRLKSGLSRNET